MSRGYTFADLFCGAGGMSLGFEQAGFRGVFASDINRHAARTYMSNRTGTMTEDQMFTGDIADLIRSLDRYAPLMNGADVICGGPPCQGFSAANRRRIIDDPRNVLYKSFLTVLARVRPAFFVRENVRGMCSRLEEITADVRAIVGSEYAVASDVLNARDYGVPQNRLRFFMIGSRVSDPEAVMDSVRAAAGTFPAFTLRDAIADLPPLSPNRQRGRNNIENDDVGFTWRPYVYPETLFRSFINGKRDVACVWNHKNRYNNDRDIEIYSRLPQGGNSLDPSIADIMPYTSRNHIFKDKYFKLKYDEPCRTITSHMRCDCNMYIHPEQPRGLSAREAARIQTFPDWYVLTGPQTDWYRQVGNAVPVKLAEAVAAQIAHALDAL